MNTEVCQEHTTYGGGNHTGSYQCLKPAKGVRIIRSGSETEEGREMPMCGNHLRGFDRRRRNRLRREAKEEREKWMYRFTQIRGILLAELHAAVQEIDQNKLAYGPEHPLRGVGPLLNLDREVVIGTSMLEEFFGDKGEYWTEEGFFKMRLKDLIEFVCTAKPEMIP